MADRFRDLTRLLPDAVLDRRWAVLTRLDLDLATAATWDRVLPRDRRVLVPVDVQAFVATDDAEDVVPLTGGHRDPPPFATGGRPPAGVHLHWAMPDALLQAAAPDSDDESGAGAPDGTGDQLALPLLPDRWVVVRALLPVGLDRPLVRGWVVDAAGGTTVPLAQYDGSFPDGGGTEAVPVRLERLDGISGGSPLWTASYHASAGRFGFHDPLDDLDELLAVAEQGFEADQAVYTVAGWWSRREDDPLATTTSTALRAVLARFGWHLDVEAADGAARSGHPHLRALQHLARFARPPESPPTEILTPGRRTRFSHSDLSPHIGLPVGDAARVVLAPQGPRYSSLLHGAVTGVPIGGTLVPGDDRPEPASLQAAVGLDTDDLVAAFGAATLGLEQRRAAERLAAAFSSDLLDRLGSPEGVDDIAEHEHGDTFWGFPGPPLPEAVPDRLRAEDATPLNPTAVGRKGRARVASPFERIDPKARWRHHVALRAEGQPPSQPATRVEEQVPTAPPGVEVREVVRPAPRLFRPQPPIVAVRGARPSLRHHHDRGLDGGHGLACRFAEEAVTGIRGVITGRDLIPTLGSGAVPDEVVTVVREAVLLDPYSGGWLAAAASPGDDDGARRPLEARFVAEMLRLYSPDGRYDGTGAATLSTAPRGRQGGNTRKVAGDHWSTVSAADVLNRLQAAVELAEASLLEGTPPSPVAITAWRQPWAPLWLEWEVTPVGHDTLEGWALGRHDLEPDGTGGPAPLPLPTIAGRNPVGRGVARALHAGIRRWLEAEQQRDSAGLSVLDPDEQRDLARLGELLAPLDLASASLDGLREQLLGIAFQGALATPDGSDDRPEADGPATPMFGGTVRIDRLRLVDAFGRTLEVGLDPVLTTSTLEVEGEPAAIRIPPRIQHAARWLLRLVDPAHEGDPASAPEAYVDQLDPAAAVNPVAGFLLPDHVDEALEVFDADGSPIGELRHDDVSGGVRWEPAPGRPVPPGAGPLEGLHGGARLAGRLAAGTVRADVRARAHDQEPAESSLTAMLRALDTALWSVDTFAALGTPHVAGLVGRPVAVVRATLRLEVPDDLDEVRVTAAGGAPARSAAFDRLREQSFPVRLGDLHRSDDSLLGFFVDDDFERFHLVDKVVAEHARDIGRRRGHLGLLGEAVALPPLRRLDHPYLVTDDTLHVRPGQVLRLTLLMLPAGRVHLTSGILPRKSLALADAWVEHGLRRLVPSVRVGPVLVDPAEIRLPKVDLLGERQQFTRRTGPLTWRDDPIVASTQAALLPRTPHEIQEGWIRIEDEGDDG